MALLNAAEQDRHLLNGGAARSCIAVCDGAESENAGIDWQCGLGIPNLPAVIAEDLAIFDCKLGQAVLIQPGLPPQSPENYSGLRPETFRNFHL